MANCDQPCISCECIQSECEKSCINTSNQEDCKDECNKSFQNCQRKKQHCYDAFESYFKSSWTCDYDHPNPKTCEISQQKKQKLFKTCVNDYPFFTNEALEKLIDIDARDACKICAKCCKDFGELTCKAYYENCSILHGDPIIGDCVRKYLNWYMKQII